MSGKTALKTPLPKGWSNSVKSAVLRTISLAHYTTVYARGWAVRSPNKCVRLKADNERLDAELSLLREEMRIKDARMAQIAPHRRPFYPPTERLAIRELKTARGWPSDASNRQSASRSCRVFVRQAINRRVVSRPSPLHVRPHKTR